MAYTYTLGGYSPGALAATPPTLTGAMPPYSWAPTYPGVAPETLDRANMALQSQMLRKELYTNAGVSGVMGALQLGAQALPTAEDVRNKEKLNALLAREKTGTLGLSGAERQQLEAEQMNPVRALAHEQRVRAEAMQAASGDSTSAADLNRIARTEGATVAGAAQQAGLAVGRANLEKAAEQVKEIEERTSYKSNRQAQLLNMAGQTLAGMAAPVGTAMAYRAQTRPPTDEELNAMATQYGLTGMTPDQLRAWYNQNLGTAQYNALTSYFNGPTYASWGR